MSAARRSAARTRRPHACLLSPSRPEPYGGVDTGDVDLASPHADGMMGKATQGLGRTPSRASLRNTGQVLVGAQAWKHNSPNGAQHLMHLVGGQRAAAGLLSSYHPVAARAPLPRLGLPLVAMPLVVLPPLPPAGHCGALQRQGTSQPPKAARTHVLRDARVLHAQGLHSP